MRWSLIAQVAAGVFDTLAAIATAVLTLLMVWLVIARYLNIPVIGIFEIVGIFAMASYMLGAAIASRRGTHLVVDWLEQRLTDPRARALQQLAVGLLMVLATGLFVYWSYRMMLWGLKRPQATPAFRIPMWVPQLPLLVGSLGCLAYALRDTLRAALALGGSGAGGPGPARTGKD